MNINEHRSHMDLLNQTRELLTSAKPDEYGRLRPSSDVAYFDIAVTKSSVARAIKLFQLLLTELERSVTSHPMVTTF